MIGTLVGWSLGIILIVFIWGLNEIRRDRKWHRERPTLEELTEIALAGRWGYPPPDSAAAVVEAERIVRTAAE